MRAVASGLMLNAVFAADVLAQTGPAAVDRVGVNNRDILRATEWNPFQSIVACWRQWRAMRKA
jgi:hypothetical protein